MKHSEIIFSIQLDDNAIPERIQWDASDSGMSGKRDCGATMLALWDPNDRTTLRIDLWTKEMPVDDMKRFFYESMKSMADTYQRATEDKENAEMMRKFSDRFAEKTGLFQK
jgi:gliding motility-associated protein GldC